MKRRVLLLLLQIVVIFTTFVIFISAKNLNDDYDWLAIDGFVYKVFVLFLVLILLFVAEILKFGQLDKGWEYAKLYWSIIIKLEEELINAGIYNENLWWASPPTIKLSVSADLTTGILKIRNSVRLNKRLDDFDLSAALGIYKVERHYLSNDANYYIYELLRADKSFRMIFENRTDFNNYAARCGTYQLFLDSRTTCNLQHTLIVGQTGSGKTYALFSLILQMLNKPIQHHLYFIDPKGASVDVLGQNLFPNRTVSEFDDIMAMLETFVSEMANRKAEMHNNLGSYNKLDADYTYFNLSPHILLIDEYAAFMAVVNSKSKGIRDHVNELMSQIVLMGRQLGFFAFIVMQKSDATLISTALRDNLPLKIVLGNAEPTTYETTFGKSIDIPPLNYLQGDGVFTEPTLANTPKLVQFPTLNFDILEAAKMSAGVW